MMASAGQDLHPVGTIWTFSLDEPATVVRTRFPAVFSRVDLQSAPELALAMGADGLTEVTQRFRTGRHCYVARVDGRIAAYGWVSFDEEFIGELNLRLRLLPGEAYIWNCATLPAYRHNYLYSALLVYIVCELRKEQLSRLWIGADIDNTTSQRGIARAGFMYVADLFVTWTSTLQRMWLQGKPEVMESLVAEASRVFGIK